MTSSGGVAIVVDSAASLPEDLSRRHGLHVVPLEVSLGGETYLDGRDLSPTDFYKKLRNSTTLASTSAPSPARFLQAFRAAAEGGSAVLCLTVSSSFSASYDSAGTAAAEARETAPAVDITVLDTETAAGAEGLVALEAARAAERGLDVNEVMASAREVMSRVQLIAFIDTLYYLWKSGRVPMIAHTGTSLLGIKPIFEMSGGRVRGLARPRTRRRATARLMDLLNDRAGPGRLHATVMHGDAEDEANELRERVAADFQCEELFVSEFTPAMGAHLGPGVVGIAFWSEPS